MKLFALKLVALLVLIGAVLVAAVSWDCSYIINLLEQARSSVAAFVGPAWKMPWLVKISAIVMGILSLYAFLPKLPKRSTKRLTYASEHGDIVIDLKPVHKTLLRVIRSMPEVKKIKIKLKGDRSGKKAIIAATANIDRQIDGSHARDNYEMINYYIEETATRLLGLDILEPIKLSITGVTLDPAAASAAVRNQLTDMAAAATAPEPPDAGMGTAPSAAVVPLAEEDSIQYAASPAQESVDYAPTAEPQEHEPSPFATPEQQDRTSYSVAEEEPLQVDDTPAQDTQDDEEQQKDPWRPYE